MSPPFTTGQAVRLEYNGQIIDASIELVSRNGRSLMLTFDGVLVAPGGGMLVGSIPLLLDDEGTYRDLAVSAPALLTPCDNHHSHEETT